MAKKKRQAEQYDSAALTYLGVRIKNSRKEIEEGALIKLNINLTKLEEAVKMLPKKEREALEKYWGLIPGTPIRAHDKKFQEGISKDASKMLMAKSAFQALMTLSSLDYVCIYDAGARELIDQVAGKVDKGGMEMSNMDIVKYLIIFLVFILDGPKMIYEEQLQMLTDEQEKIAGFDLYTFMQITWNAIIKDMEDESINLKLLMQMLDMFECREVAYMKRYVGLPLHPDYQKAEFEPLESFSEIRNFKEKMFPYGAWDVTSSLIFYQGIKKVKLEKFAKKVPGLKRSNWATLEDYKGESKGIMTSKGVVELPTYKIGGMDFTDTYEVQFLCLADTAVYLANTDVAV